MRDDEKHGPSGGALRGTAGVGLKFAMRPNEVEAVSSVLDEVERAADSAGAAVAPTAFLAMREMGAALLAFNCVRSLDDLMIALGAEIQRRAAELRLAPNHDDLPPADFPRRLPRPPVRH
jgi:anaerobic selenocysteine-containing dehydrogenase